MAADKSLLDVICDQLESVISKVTVDVWLDLVDLQTEEILKNPSVQFWDPKAIIIPTNIQLLSAHYASEVMEGADKFSNSEKLKLMVKSFAKSYDKTVELHMDDMSLEDLLANAKRETVTWKLESYLTYLTTAKLDSCCRNDEALKLLSSHPELVTKQVKDLYAKTFEADSSPLLSDVFKSVFEKSNTETCQKILEEHVEKQGLDKQLKTSSFYRNCRQFFNRSVSEGDQVDLRLLYSLALQAPGRVLKLLLDEAVESSGKVPVMMNLVSYIPCVALYQVDGKAKIISDILQRLKSNIDNKSVRDNLLQMVRNFPKSDVWKAGYESVTIELSIIFASNAGIESYCSFITVIGLLLESEEALSEKGKLKVARSLSMSLEQDVNVSLQDSVMNLLLNLSEKNDRMTEFVRASVPKKFIPYFLNIPENGASLLHQIQSKHLAPNKEIQLNSEKTTATLDVANAIPHLLKCDWPLLLDAKQEKNFATLEDKLSLISDVFFCLQKIQHLTQSQVQLATNYLMQSFTSQLSESLEENFRLAELSLCVALALNADLRASFCDIPSLFVVKLCEIAIHSFSESSEGHSVWKRILGLVYCFPEGDKKDLLKAKVELCN